VGAGTGVAPFRGFIQERVAMIKAGRRLAPALLYYGCREPGKDDLYTEEFTKWEKLGAVTVKRAYSRAPEKSGGNKYVQDVLYADREAAIALWEKDAQLYVCGSRKVGQGVEDTCLRIRTEGAKALGLERSNEEIQKWWTDLRNVRYATDVFD
jgi:cytochrome P450 / NADPH-cytochrome P450 reductase